MGRMGMSIGDFDLCTPHEFSVIAEGWHDYETMRMRDAWERTRMTCLCMLQPYSKKKLRAEDVLEFSWEKQPKKKLSAEDVARQKERFEEVKKRRGLH